MAFLLVKRIKMIILNHKETIDGLVNLRETTSLVTFY